MLYMGMIGVLMMFAMKTRQRAHEWTTEQLLFTSAIRVCPDNAKVYYNIGRLATDRRTAFQYYSKAIRYVWYIFSAKQNAEWFDVFFCFDDSLYPEYEAALMNLGNMYREQNDLGKAEQYLRRAIDVVWVLKSYICL